MNKEDKKKNLSLLTENELYKNILSSLKDNEERRKIKAFAEDIFMNLMEGLQDAKKLVEENPEKVAEYAEKHIPKK
jgi:hypothetical protein